MSAGDQRFVARADNRSAAIQGLMGEGTVGSRCLVMDRAVYLLKKGSPLRLMRNWCADCWTLQSLLKKSENEVRYLSVLTPKRRKASGADSIPRKLGPGLVTGASDD